MQLLITSYLHVELQLYLPQAPMHKLTVGLYTPAQIEGGAPTIEVRSDD